MEKQKLNKMHMCRRQSGVKSPSDASAGPFHVIKAHIHIDEEISFVTCLDLYCVFMECVSMYMDMGFLYISWFIHIYMHR